MLLNELGIVKVCDFGLAKLMDTSGGEGEESKVLMASPDIFEAEYQDQDQDQDPAVAMSASSLSDKQKKPLNP